jgi:thiaminase/transcriptional activator TenA
VLVPAEWIYHSWASAVETDPGRSYLAEWVALHANPEFETFVSWLRTELDRAGAAAGPRRRHRLDRLFSRTVELEAAFFESAYGPAPETRTGATGSDATADDRGVEDGGGGTEPW